MVAGSMLCQNKKASFKMSCAGNMFLAYGREKNRKKSILQDICALQ